MGSGKLDYSLIPSISFARPERACAAVRIAARRPEFPEWPETVVGKLDQPPVPSAPSARPGRAAGGGGRAARGADLRAGEGVTRAPETATPAQTPHPPLPLYLPLLKRCCPRPGPRPVRARVRFPLCVRAAEGGGPSGPNGLQMCFREQEGASGKSKRARDQGLRKCDPETAVGKLDYSRSHPYHLRARSARRVRSGSRRERRKSRGTLL
eukprot:gene10235-biopygen10807